MREWLNRLRDRFRRGRLDAELAEELAFHRRQLERDALHSGASVAEARRAAHLRLGNESVVRETVRERWGIPWIERTAQAFRHAARSLRRAPAFSLTVILTLGLGIGANATMFRVVDQLMYRPLALLRDPGSVHRIYYQWTDRGRPVTAQATAYARHLDIVRGTRSFSQTAAFSERTLPVGEGIDLTDTQVGAVSASYFAFFDAPPVRGRYFLPEEDRTPRGVDVAVLSYAYWRSQFGGADVLGRMLQVGNIRAEIVGVAPPGFAGVNDANPPALWIPITAFAGSQAGGDATTYHTRYQWGFMFTLVRLAPGVTPEQASADATQAFQRSWEAQFADGVPLPSAAIASPRAIVSAVRPGGGPDPAREARTALWTLAVAAIVLVIAVANVANLVVARALQRQREQAVRLALGAGVGRLVLHSVTESLLALVSSATALLLARWASAGVGALLGVFPSGPPTALADWRVVLLTLSIALCAGVALGLFPVLLLRRRILAHSLRGGVRGGTTRGARVRGTLLLVQGALSTVLLIGAVLFVRSLDKLRSTPMGYDADQVLVVNRVLRGPWPGDEAVRTMTRELLDAAAAMPEVEAAAWASTVPFLSTSEARIFIAGRDSTAALGTFTNQVTTPGYFRTMGTRIVRGRALTDDDRIGAPEVAVVSESMARSLWPGVDAIGQCFRTHTDTMPCVTVVGIAEDMVQRDIAGSQRLHYYVPLAQSTRTHGNILLLRVRGDPAVHAESIRRSLRRAVSGDVHLRTTLLRETVLTAQGSWRLGATMFVAFGVLALLVAAVGLHGVIAYDVALRRHELAVRVALGGRRGDILRLVIGRGIRLMLGGAIAGAAVAAYAGRWIEPLLFDQRAVDPVAYALVVGLLLAVALVASAVPAWRAAGADPAGALRAE